MTQSFILQMFPEHGLVVPAGVRGIISRQSGVIELTFELNGDFTDVVLPAGVNERERRNGLWRSTCFECFLGLAGTAAYWEMNLSPAGHWNVYRFDSYRQGMTEERNVRTLQSAVAKADPIWRIGCRLHGIPALRDGRPVTAGVSCILEHRDGRKSYWALRHGHAKPDFHHQDGFILHL